MRPWILVGLMLAAGPGAAAQNPAKPGDEKKTDKAASSLRQAIEKADLVVIGKVTQVGLSAASSFDVGALEVREVLKGDKATKEVHFRFPSRGNEAAARYGKKGVEGVWVLDKKGAYLSARPVLAYRPLAESAAVRKLIPTKEQPVEPPPDKKK